MSGSPCPACRTPMRWIPAMQQWGCDTCRVMYPAQPVVQSFAMAMTPKRSSRKLVIGISLAAIVGAGVAITLIAMQHKKTAAPVAAASGSDPSIEIVADTDTGDAGTPVAAISKKPLPVAPVTPVAPRDTTLGKPEQLELADFWLWPRKDGSYLVTSPVFEVVFPHRPTAKVDPLSADGKTYDVYTLSDDLQGRGLLQLQLLMIGRGARDAGVVVAVKALAAKVGPVTESHRTDRGLEVARLEATSATSGDTIRLDYRRDLPRGLLAIANATFIKSDQPTAEAFLDSIHIRAAPDVDPKSLTVRVRKEHGKNEAHDAADSFKLDLPWATKVTRLPSEPDSHIVGVTIAAIHGKASAALEILELAPWDALGFGPRGQKLYLDNTKGLMEKAYGLEVKVAAEKLGGIPAMRLDAKGHGHSYHTHVMWNRYQHRRYALVCIDAPCDVVALSLKFADPVAVP